MYLLASFIPMKFPQLPLQYLNPELIPIIDDLKEKLQRGYLSLSEVEVELSKLTFLAINEDEIFTTAHEFQSLRQIEETEDENCLDNSKSFESNDDSFVKVPFESNIEDVGVESVSAVEEDTKVQSVELEGKPNSIEPSSTEQRLVNVEQMLEKLMNHMNEQSSVNQPSNPSISRAQNVRPSLITSGTSMVSALTNSDNIADGSAAIKQNDTRDREQLLQEIDDLKRQLLYVQQNPQNYINTLNETTSTSTGIENQKKRKRKKLMKKPWK